MATQPPDRKALLRARGRLLKDIAVRAGVSKSHLSRVLSGERRSMRLERVIAQELGLPVRDVFPERYSRKGAA